MRALSWLLSAAAFHGAATAQLPVEVHRQPQELLTSDEARLAANKKLVFDFWRVVRQAHHAERTPEYLAEIGLLSRERIPSEDKDIGLLLRQALDRVAFLPFGLLIDRWRWGVFDGSITPDRYNEAWDEMRLRYQGVVPPVARTDTDFDPGAKYHVPGNTPYTRYFLARILQFQL